MSAIRFEARSLRPLAHIVSVMVLVACAQIPPATESGAKPESQTPATAPAPPAPPVAAPSPETSTGWRQRGRVSLYGKDFAGKRTASGTPFDPQRLTMAHRTLPFGTVVRVTNLENRQSVEVVVNDRGPFVPGRIADLSEAAAHQLGMVVDGVVDAMLEVIQPGKRSRSD